MAATVCVLVEGPTDDIVIKRLCEHVGVGYQSCGARRGKEYVLQSLPNFNKIAEYQPLLVMLDLDQAADCAPDFIKKILPNPSRGMCFRIAVQALEAWLLADIENMAAFLDISPAKFPQNPDAEPNPKKTLVSLVTKYCTHRKIREDILPDEKSGNPVVGRGYRSRIEEFVMNADVCWRPDVAMTRSDSLRRCVSALQTFKEWD